MSTLRVFKLIACFLLLACSTASAQLVKDYPEHRLWFSPIRVFDFVHPGFELAYEVKYNRRLSTQFNGTILADPLHITEFRNFSGFRLGIDQKVFINRFLYVAGEAAFIRSNFRYDATFNKRLIDKYYYETYDDEIGVHKRIFMVNAKFGIQINKGQFMFGADAGLGIRFRNVAHSDRINPADSMSRPRHPNIWYMATNAGNGATLNIPFTVQIGYKF